MKLLTRTKKPDSSPNPSVPAPRGPGWRGYHRPGGGYVGYVEPAPEWRGTTVQACGLWAFAAAGAAPTIGVPIGRNLLTGATVCCDPISWFHDAKLLLNPSMFVLGLPALGKSTFVRRQVIGLAGAGVTPLILGDRKPDQRRTVEALGGQIVELGRGRGSINVLDLGELDAAALRLTGEAAHRLREEAHARRLNMVIALIALVRQGPVNDTERTVLSAALRVLAQHPDPTKPAVLADLAAVLDNPPESVRLPTLDRGDDTVYRHATDPLARTIIALLNGPFGDVFAKPTTTRLRLDAPAVCVDVSGLNGHDSALQAAVLLATWAEGYGAVEAANALADAGLAPQRRFFIVLDELWQLLGAGGAGMVDRIDSLTRLNRNDGVGQVMITHTIADLRSLPSAADQAKAKGFIERAGMVVLGGLPPAELAEVTEIVRLSEAEKDMVTGWSSPPSMVESAEPPGRGNFLLKVGGRPGVPVHLDLTQAELAAGIHDTNLRWAPPTQPESPPEAPKTVGEQGLGAEPQNGPAAHVSVDLAPAPEPEPVRRPTLAHAMDRFRDPVPPKQVRRPTLAHAMDPFRDPEVTG